MPRPALEAALHADSIILYIAVPFGFRFSLACADRTYRPVGGKAPFGPLRCIPVFPMGAPGCCACTVVRCSFLCPLALARSEGCRARCVPCCALLRSPGGVCVGASVRLPDAGWPGLVARRPLAWRGGSLGPLPSSLPQVFCDPVPWCSRFLNLLSWDITCTQVVCPDAGPLCALPWVTGDLVTWCMIFSGVMRAGGFQGARRAGLGITVPCSPAGASGLVGFVGCAPGPPRVWLAGEGVRRKERNRGQCRDPPLAPCC